MTLVNEDRDQTLLTCSLGFVLARLLGRGLTENVALWTCAKPARNIGKDGKACLIRWAMVTQFVEDGVPFETIKRELMDFGFAESTLAFTENFYGKFTSNPSCLCVFVSMCLCV